MALWLSMLLACGGGRRTPRPKPKVQQPTANPALGLQKDGFVPPPLVKIPKIRPPFFTLPEAAGKGVIGGDTGRELVVPIQKGPFGPSETLTLFFREQITPDEGAPFVGVGLIVVIKEGQQQAGYPVDLQNDLPLVGQPELQWVNAEQGWLPVLLIERQGTDGVVRQNQSIVWDEKKKEFVHAEQEPVVAELDDADRIQAAFK